MTARDEEAAARAALRHQQKMQTAAAKARAAAERERVTDAIRATRHLPCRCRLRPGMMRQDLRALGAGCTDPFYVCPRLVAVRLKVG